MYGSQQMRALTAALVVGASLYLFALCWLHAIGLPINDGTVAAVDGAIVLTALLAAGLCDPQRVGLLVAAVSLNFLVLGLFAQGLDLKSLRDAFVICGFASLGALVGDLRLARWTLFGVAAFVVGFGAFEAINPALFGELFQVLQFYIMRGAVESGVAQYADTSLFVSSMRGDDRNLLPFLGPHRVSSIFLEPVSMGNFGAIAIAFALSLDRRHRSSAVAAGVVGAVAIFAADARFAAIAVLFFALARAVPPSIARLVLLPLPFAAVAILIVMASLIRATGDDLPTRLAASGAIIANLDVPSLFGLRTAGRETLDSGYAYVLMAFGLPFCVLAWLAFVFLPTPGHQSTRFKLLLGVYICALLCISGSSLFALKTAALAWFLLGSLIAEERVAARGATRPIPRLQGQPA